MKSPAANSTQTNRAPWSWCPARPKSRQASILVCVLVCLAIATAIVTSTVRSALGARRAMRSQHQLRQTELLLVAGVQRASQQLQADAEFGGETWQLAPRAIPGTSSALVKIEVAQVAGDGSRRIDVTAQLSPGTHATVQRSYSFSFNPQPSPDK